MRAERYKTARDAIKRLVTSRSGDELYLAAKHPDKAAEAIVNEWLRTRKTGSTEIEPLNDDALCVAMSHDGLSQELVIIIKQR